MKFITGTFVFLFVLFCLMIGLKKVRAVDSKKLIRYAFYFYSGCLVLWFGIYVIAAI